MEEEEMAEVEEEGWKISLTCSLCATRPGGHGKCRRLSLQSMYTVRGPLRGRRMHIVSETAERRAG